MTAMTVMVAIFLSVIGVAVAALLVPQPYERREDPPLQPFATRAAAATERIVRLHRELGIDAIYDPIPPVVSDQRQVPSDVEFLRRMAEPPPQYVPPLRLYKCARCDYTISDGMPGYKSVFNDHLSHEHGIDADAPSSPRP